MTAVTLLKRMANFFEETARYVAPSKAIAFDTLAVNVRLRANTYLCRAVLAFVNAILIMPSQDFLSFFDGCPVAATASLGQFVEFLILTIGFCHMHQVTIFKTPKPETRSYLQRIARY